MPRRKPGLPAGYNLTERFNEGMAEILAREEKRKRSLESQRIAGGAKVDEDGNVIVEDNKPVQDIDSALFNTVTVAQIANKPDDPSNYGQGPAGSTRLCSHKFVIDQPMFDLYGAKMGYILVRFHKNGRRGPDWVYGPVDVSVYQQFASSNSKGHFINTTLNGYGYKPASETPYANQFSDFPANSGTDSAGIRL
ncbi:MAG: hypothetical protein EBU82_13315 [Flavobacteriia bacterium]|nr:hypothetical protein [Flavobacteriia bacterium]